jgi:phosphate-selective porin OprO/OprP
MKDKVWAAVLAATSLTVATPALAQETGDADLAAQLAAMRAKIENLEAEVATLKAAKPAATPSWKGAPQLEDKEAGFSFKPKGFIQIDSGYVGNPGIETQNLGYSTRARRIVFGAEGSLPGGFGYKAEFNLAGGSVDYEDVVLTYQPKNGPIQLTIGNFYPMSGLETMTSSRLTSFLERAQAVDAFGFSRRLGLAIGVTDPGNDRYTLTAGIFNAPLASGFNNDSWQASVRGTFSPKIGEGARLHLGANYQHRETQSDAQNFRYRARPFTQLTDVRFADTGAIAASGDDIVGLELGGIFGPLHFAAEGQKVWTDAYAPGTLFEGLNGAGGGAFYDADPSFASAYAEVGYYLTGETRGYRAGRWDRTKVLNPVGKGGIGAIQLNARIDYLDLEDRVSSGAIGAPRFINGGSQTGYQLSAIWNPIDYVRFLLQYTHTDVEGGPFAATVEPDSGETADARSYGLDSLAVRAQVEF